jgi:hypothetical protein
MTGLTFSAVPQSASEHGVHTARIFFGAVILTSPPSLASEIQGELVHAK